MPAPDDPYSSISSVDADGLTRVVGTIDIGPYEHGATSVPAPIAAPTQPPEGGGEDSPGAAAPAAEVTPPAALHGSIPVAPVEGTPEVSAGKRPFEVLGVSRRRGIAVLRVGIPRPGHLSMRGSGVRSWRGSASRAGIMAMPIRPTRTTSVELRRMGSAKVGVVLRYRSGGAPRSIRTFLELVTRHGGLVPRATAQHARRRAAQP